MSTATVGITFCEDGEKEDVLNAAEQIEVTQICRSGTRKHTIIGV